MCAYTCIDVYQYTQHAHAHAHIHTQRTHALRTLACAHTQLHYVLLLQVPIVASLPVASVMSWHNEMGLLLVAVSGDQNIHIWNVKD